jgi:hypothetical protein
MLFLVFGTVFDLGLAFAFEAAHGAVAGVIGIAMLVFGFAFILLAIAQAEDE